MFNNRSKGALLLAGAIFAVSATTHAATRHVENWGDDGSACSTSAPCRSISHAVTIAALGDTIIVGPGLYSDDLDNDGVFNEPGEEPMTGIPIDRDVTIQSSDGASATLIRWTQATGMFVVNLTADGIIFGKKNKGFTLSLLEEAIGISILSGGTNAEIAGNVVKYLPAPGTVVFSIGIFISNPTAYVHDNKVIGARNSPYAHIVSVCYWAAGTGSRVERNTALNCDIGFEASGGTGMSLARNVAIGHDLSGYSVEVTADFTRNAAIGNDKGVHFSAPPGLFDKNSFIGTTGAMNCGLENNTGGVVAALNSFWGATTGPGADPADNVCNVGMSTTSTSPFITTDFTQLQTPQR